MRDAVRTDDTLAAPTVGTWRPAIGVGAPLSEGGVLGHVVRLGRKVAVRAPRGSGGVAVQVAASGAEVEHGTVLVRMGEGGLAGLAEAPAAPIAADAPEGAVAVCADTDGTVYLRPEPGSPAFAAEGSRVEAHATVALVEVMKTFTPARSPVAGVVVRVDVDDAGSVEAGAPILWVRPDAG